MYKEGMKLSGLCHVHRPQLKSRRCDDVLHTLLRRTYPDLHRLADSDFQGTPCRG